MGILLKGHMSYTTIPIHIVERDTTLDPGEHDGYEESYSIAQWGEPDSMEQIDTLVIDEYER